jgi:ribosomal protein S18 acetylase RimI-like enzyme
MTNRTSTDAGIAVRKLRASDLEDVVRIDAKNTGKARRDYYRIKLGRVLEDTSVQMSFAAELDGAMVGFLFASLFYGDYGQPETIATLEAIATHPELERRGVASALWCQFLRNVKALRIDTVRTEVDWQSLNLLTFFHHLGFAPARRICLERDVDFEADD